MLLQEGGENEEAPDAVDDGGNTGEQFNRRPNGSPQGLRTELGQKDRHAEADRHGDDHGDEGGDDGAVDGGERAIMAGGRIPDIGDKKAEPKGTEGRYRAVDQRRDDAAEDQ